METMIHFFVQHFQLTKPRLRKPVRKRGVPSRSGISACDHLDEPDDERERVFFPRMSGNPQVPVFRQRALRAQNEFPLWRVLPTGKESNRQRSSRLLRRMSPACMAEGSWVDRPGFAPGVRVRVLTSFPPGSSKVLPIDELSEVWGTSLTGCPALSSCTPRAERKERLSLRRNVPILS